MNTDFFNPRDIKSKTLSELRDELKELGLPRYRADQVYRWLHRGVRSFEEMTNLPKDLRETLKETCLLAPPVVARKQLCS